MPASEGWAEIWDGLENITKRTLQGETVSFNKHFLAMERHGFAEETYHSFSYVPFMKGPPMSTSRRETGEALERERGDSREL
jgi:hypothetical protein